MLETAVTPRQSIRQLNFTLYISAHWNAAGAMP